MRAGLDWHSLGDESEGFWLRILGPGDYRYHGADLGMLVTRARMQGDDGELTDGAQAWIKAIRGRFAGTPLPEDEPPPPAAMITADGSSDLKRRARALGYPLLHKPVRPAALRALLTTLLRKQRDTQLVS